MREAPSAADRGKGLSDDVVATLEEDAAAFTQVLAERLQRTTMSEWRDQADIAAMS